MFNSVNNSVAQFFRWRILKILIVKGSPLPPLSHLVVFPSLEEGVLVVDGSRSPSFPLLALHPFQLEERRLALPFLALLRSAACSASSGGLRLAPSFLRWGWGRRASRRQRGRRWLRRTTGSAGQVHSQRWGLMESQGGAW